MLVVSLASPALRAETVLETFELRHSLPEDLVPVLRPLVEPEGTLTSARNLIIVRASPERIAEIRALIAQLDRPPRNLIIHVRHGRIAERQGSAVAGGADLQTGDVRWRLGQPPGPDRIGVRAGAGDQRSSLQSDQQVRATEGRPAFIDAGSVLPLQESRQWVYPGGGSVHRRTLTTYQPATTGFYVVPRLVGERVTLSLRQHMDRPAGPGGVLDVQRADTTLTGRLGEWIPVGGVGESGNFRSSGLGSAAQGSASIDHQIYLMVEPVD